MLEAQSITFGYDNNHILFQNLILKIDFIDRLEIRAPSGFGKTTLCKLLAGYLVPQKGKITVDGNTLIYKGRSQVQLVGQHPEHVLDPRMRVGESLKEACSHLEENNDLIKRLGIKEKWLTRFPHELSGGEMQRFCIARALLAKPRYLIADEISTMLDAITQAQIWSVILDEINYHHIGLIFVSHSQALSDRIRTKICDLTKL